MADSPEALATWNSGWTTAILKLCILTVLFAIGLALLFSVGSLKEIAENFPKYRCNPLLMPFASSFGYDSKENFNFCLTSIFNIKAAEIFGPIYTLLSGFTDIVKLIVDVALGIRKLFSNFLLGMNNFVRNVRDRIQGLMFNIRMSFLKINNLMGRVYGTMYAVIWMGMSAMTAGFNVADNDLVKFLFEFCFDPNTPIQLEGGTYTSLKEIRIGDRLAPLDNGTVPVVTSVFRFRGDHTPMVNIHDILVSGSHYVKGYSGWIPAASHPDAFAVPSIPQLVCLNVTGHVFKIGQTNLLVSDYDEHGTDEVVRATQQTAIHALNSKSSSPTLEDYSLGVDPRLRIRMKDGSWKPIVTIQLGDKIWNAGTVLGIVCEVCDTVVKKDGVIFSAAQTLYHDSTGLWSRVGIVMPDSIVHEPTILYSVITQQCGTIHARHPTNDREYFLRDYREVAIESMEDAYENEFLANK